MTLSIVMPVLNEAAGIEDTLRALADYRARGVEVIVVDGGSSDDTVARAEPFADHVIESPRGRANQMNAGAAVAKGDVLLFLHADTRLPEQRRHADRRMAWRARNAPGAALTCASTMAAGSLSSPS